MQPLTTASVPTPPAPPIFRLRYWRQKRGLRLIDLSALTGIPYQRLSQYERGGYHIPAALLPLLARTLCVSVEDLYDPAFLFPCPTPEKGPS